MPLRVGTTSGIYYAARSAELSTAVKKLGYTLTRGAACMEIPFDVAHEVTFIQGRAIRSMAEQQNVEVLAHGDLTCPFEMPDRSEWRDAHERAIKSLRSAIYTGATYVNFHASLNIWLELITYAGRKLTLTFCDHQGKFIGAEGGILQTCEDLRNWFVEKRIDDYARDVMTEEERTQYSTRVTVEEDKWRKGHTKKRVLAVLEKHKSTLEKIEAQQPGATEELTRRALDAALLREMPAEQFEKGMLAPIYRDLETALDNLKEDRVRENAKITKGELKEIVKEKLAQGKKWDSEELRAVVGVIDGYHIFIRYLFYTQDPWIRAESGPHRNKALDVEAFHAA